MSCEATREQLMALETAAFGEVVHLRTCPECRAFADQLRAADAAMVAHVEAFAESGDFREEWAEARRRAKIPRRAVYFSTATLSVLALAALALLVFRPPQEAPIPPTAPQEPVTVPVPAPVQAADPAPEPLPLPVRAVPAADPIPASDPIPVPEPVAVPTPEPVALPTPAEPPPMATSRPPAAAAAPPDPVILEPSPAPIVADPSRSTARPPRHSRPAPSLTVRIDPGISGVRSGDLTCGATRIRGSLAGDVLRFDRVPDGPCTLEVHGVRAPVSAGRSYRLTADGVVED